MLFETFFALGSSCDSLVVFGGWLIDGSLAFFSTSTARSTGTTGVEGGVFGTAGAGMGDGLGAAENPVPNDGTNS